MRSMINLYILDQNYPIIIALCAAGTLISVKLVVVPPVVVVENKFRRHTALKLAPRHAVIGT